MNRFSKLLLIFGLGFLVNGNLRSEKLSPGFGFIENKGQIVDQNNILNKDVLFLYSEKAFKVQLRKTGYSYELCNVENLPQLSKGKKFHEFSQLTKAVVNNYRVDIDFLGMNSGVEVIAEQVKDSYINYFSSGINVSGIHSYNKITYKNAYQNIDIEFLVGEGADKNFKYNIILHPGANIKDVKLLCGGASSVFLANNNSVIIKTPLGNMNELIPFSYYTDSPFQDQKVDFAVSKNIISFLADYDVTKTMVIDPSSNRIWGTYFGGSSSEYCTAEGIDGSNNVYITGYTLSNSNIATGGAYQTTLNGSFDAYLAKFNSNGAIQWATYYGGNNVEAIYCLFVEANGNSYIGGATISTTNVATGGAHQTAYGGGINDGMVAKFSANGLLTWGTYYGGNMHDIVQGITVDNLGNVVFTGHSESTTNIATVGSYNNVYGLNYDAIVVKLNSAGVRQWGTYYGDTNVDEGYGVDCDASNNIYVTGMTQSIVGISTGGAHQTIIGGGQDAFVAKFNPSGVNLLWGTYYGGTGADAGTALEVANNGNIFVGGNTTSPNKIATTNGYQQTMGSVDDAFLACFTPTGACVWGTYFGGNDVDYIMDITTDANSNILFCGETLSTNSISTTGAYQPSLAAINMYDAYFGKFSPSGNLKLATYYGGTDSEVANGIVLDNSGRVYIAGESSSTVAIASSGSYQQTYAGGQDAFVAKFCITAEPVISPATATICSGNNYTLTASSGYTNYVWSNGYTVNPIAVPGTTFTATYFYTVAVTDAYGCNGYSDSAKVIVTTCNGIKDLTSENSNLKLYPVPSGDILNVELKGTNSVYPYKIEVFSMLGELIFSKQQTEGPTTLSIQYYPAGMYFIRIMQREKTIEQKFIKD